MVRWQEMVTEAIYRANEEKDALGKVNIFWRELMSDMVKIVCLDLNLLQRTLMCALMVIIIIYRQSMFMPEMYLRI
jgi:hypothetical protein